MAENTSTTLAAVEFHGATLVTTLVDGVPHVALRPLCDAIGIDWEAQRKRITRDPVLSSVMVMTTTTGGDGKRYEMNAIPLKVLNGWLFGVDTNRVAPEVRERLIEYQRECYDALADYWQKGSATNPRASAASLMIGQATGLPTAQLVALQAQGWKIIDRLKAETVRELRADLYEDLAKVFADMGKTTPPLHTIGAEEPEQPNEVTAFWAVVKTLEAAGHRLNHSRDLEQIAINLNEVYDVARASGIRLQPQAGMKKLLHRSKAPRFQEAGKGVSSAFKVRPDPGGKQVAATVHCWVFHVLKGGAA